MKDIFGKIITTMPKVTFERASQGKKTGQYWKSFFEIVPRDVWINIHELKTYLERGNATIRIRARQLGIGAMLSVDKKWILFFDKEI